jgi:hypothetical protein
LSSASWRFSSSAALILKNTAFCPVARFLHHLFHQRHRRFAVEMHAEDMKAGFCQRNGRCPAKTRRRTENERPVVFIAHANLSLKIVQSNAKFFEYTEELQVCQSEFKNSSCSALTHKKCNHGHLLTASLPHNLCNPKFEATNDEQRLQARVLVGYPIPISGGE